MRYLLTYFVSLLLALYHSSALSYNLKIVATIKPIHSLVASVTDGISKPILLGYTESVHNYILKPSDASNLDSSNVIFYVDDNLETFVKTFARRGKELVRLSQAANLLPVRTYSFFKNIIHIRNEKDIYVWLNPENAKNMILYISTVLSRIDKKNSHKYNQNAIKAINKMDQEVRKILQELNDFRKQRYIVTHDTYQYFEKYFGLNHPNAILSMEEDAYVSIKSLIKLKKMIREENIKCIFSSSREDSIKSKLLSNNTKIVTLDPIGSSIKPGKEAYLTIINDIAQNFKSCFTESQ
ncbi:MAG: zinc ABC transporter substrate-binding protein [Wolbachia endosymbiont of Meromenopon meropis]|nr:zinc ABC transporter substrate-binding protein [Wolbachia endosymbiont of Meromenopon meropis]